jgi:hypothetical protein
MKTKRMFFVLGLVSVVGIASAVITYPFTSWVELENGTPDIVIARCTETPDPYNIRTTNGNYLLFEGTIESKIDVLSVLKGATKPGPALLSAEFWPRQRECYLIFGIYDDGKYHAYGDFHVVPLGTEAHSTNQLAGKSLDDQIKVLVHARLVDLKSLAEQVKRDIERMEDLERGFNYTNDSRRKNIIK